MAGRSSALADVERARAALERVVHLCPPSARSAIESLNTAIDRLTRVVPTTGAAHPAHADAAMVLEGDVWTIDYLGFTCRLRDTKGLHDLATLVRCTGRPVPAVDLASGHAHRASEASADRWAAREPVGRQATAELAARDPHVERARKAVRFRLRATIERLHEALPELGVHFDRSVVTGITCRYTPDRPIAWAISR